MYSLNRSTTNSSPWQMLPRLFPHHQLHIVAPASGIAEEKLQQLIALRPSNVRIVPELISTDIPYHANKDEKRAQQLIELLYYEEEPIIIWTLRGGYGSARLIDKLQNLPRPKTEKPFIGFSDNTALHLFLSQHWGWKTIHGCGFSQLLDPDIDLNNYKKIAEIIYKNKKEEPLGTLVALNQINHESAITGGLTGGNLTLIQTSIGTNWQIEAQKKILFLEEVGEKGYRIDRSLTHLHQANLFNDVKAIVFGQFTSDYQDRDIAFALQRFAQDIQIPVFKTEFFGHAKMNFPLVYNAEAEIRHCAHKGWQLRQFIS